MKRYNLSKIMKEAHQIKAGKEAMEASLAEPARRSAYDDLSIPTSAYYTNNSKGRFGSHYVGD